MKSEATPSFEIRFRYSTFSFSVRTPIHPKMALPGEIIHSPRIAAHKFIAFYKKYSTLIRLNTALNILHNTART